MTFSPFESKSIGSQDCSDKQVTGQDSTIYSYIQKNDNDDTVEDDIEPPPCPKRKHSTAQIDSLQVNTSIIGDGSINIAGGCTAGGHTLANKKDFDIPHPTKEGHRLRHVCLEGPEAGVYIRGRLKGTTITVPEYWKGLVDEESISVHLTPIGSNQDLYVESIEWGRRIQVRNASGGPIECFYLIQGERKDGEKLIPEYEGTSIEDYPGDNSQYTHNK
tara:strand:+ start:1417 stop:2070 length:654 start_codon:yes stop_codon:yes gene_type:complete